MSRRLLGVSVLTALVLGGGLLPLVGGAVAGPSACPTLGDPAGDDSTMASGAAATHDDDLDIRTVTFTSDADRVSGIVRVAKLKAGPAQLPGDTFSAIFTVNGKEIELYAFRYNPAQQDTAISLAYDATGAFVDGANPSPSASTVTAAYDLTQNAVTLSIKRTELDRLAGKPTAGVKLTSLGGATSGAEVRLRTAADDASGPSALSYTVGTACAVSAEVTSVPVVPADTLTPTAGCLHFTDPKLDGQPWVVNVTANGSNATGLPNDPALDITAATFRTTDTDVSAYITVDRLALTTANGNGPRFQWAFTYGGKALSAYTQRPDSNIKAADGASQHQILGASEGGSDTRLEVTSAWDVAHNLVRISVSRASVESVTGSALAGSLTALTVVSREIIPSGGSISADSAPTATTTYAVGDNKCFVVPTKLALTVTKKGAARTVTAKLTTSAGAAVAGKPVTFSVNGKRVATVVTGADGTAPLTSAKAGQTVSAVFLASSGYLGSSATAKA